MTPTEIRNAVHALQAQGHSLREISRSLALSRNTVRRILRQPNRTVDEAAPPSVPMTMRHRPHGSLGLGAGERHRGYAQHTWTNEHRRW
jgi:orotate phosphoribosyltransferase-like protein